MAETIDVLLLLALPASGKSEVRRYLAHLSPDECRRDFHLAETAQLDDFPYVHLMRRIDDELAALGLPRVFFHSPVRPFQDPREWGTLIHLLNEDFAALLERRTLGAARAASLLFARIDRAGEQVGIRPRLGALAAHVQHSLASRLEAEARAQQDDLGRTLERGAEGKTVILEFARGGPAGPLPFADEHGYLYSLGHLAEPILRRAAILYIWVTPEESRRKNQARANPDDPGSILHHGVPIAVMLEDYGQDDLTWLEAQAEVPGTLTVRAHGKVFHVPIGRFDNRVDKTSFVRGDPAGWSAADVDALRAGLQAALARLAHAVRR